MKDSEIKFIRATRKDKRGIVEYFHYTSIIHHAVSEVLHKGETPASWTDFIFVPLRVIPKSARTRTVPDVS